MPGIRDVANEILRLPVRIAEPERMLGLVDRLRSPAYAASLGLLFWAQVLGEQTGMDGFTYAGFTLPKFSLEKTVDFFKRLLPG